MLFINFFQVVFIMEYLEGGELLELVDKKGHFEEDEARNYFKQIVSAIAYCHSNKMIHRDLKLENLLLSNEGSDEVKVLIVGLLSLGNRFRNSWDGQSIQCRYGGCR